MSHKTTQPQKTVTKRMNSSPKSISKESKEDSESIPFSSLEKDECEPTKKLQVGFTLQYVRQLKQKDAKQSQIIKSFIQNSDRMAKQYEERQRLRNAPSIFQKTIGIFTNWFKSTESHPTTVQMHTQNQLVQEPLNKQCELIVPKSSQVKHNKQTEPYDKSKSK